MKRISALILTALMAIFVFAGSASAFFNTGWNNGWMNGSLAMVVYDPSTNEYGYDLGVANNSDLYIAGNTLWTNPGNLTLTENMSLGIFGCDVNEGDGVPYYDVFFSSTSLNPTLNNADPAITQAAAIYTLNYYRSIAGGQSSVVSPTSNMGYHYTMNSNRTTPGWMGSAIVDGTGEVELAGLFLDEEDFVSLYLYRDRLTLDDMGEVVRTLTNLGQVTFDGQTLSMNSMNPVPVPAAVWLLGSGLTGLVGLRRKLS